MTDDSLQKPITIVDDWRKNHHLYKAKFERKQSSFIPNLLQEIAIQLNVFEILDILQKRLGLEILHKALNPTFTISSPLAEHKDSSWLKQSKMVGINVRTIGNFFNVIKYALTLSKSQDAIHLLPIWEPGVVGSLYGMISFNINPEFYSPELAQAVPQLNTVEKQLKATVNLLHAMGKTVGMDAIPHTDRFSEMVIAYPRFFEWVKRDGNKIISQSEQIYITVEATIWQFLLRKGTANNRPLPCSQNEFFLPNTTIVSDTLRSEILFGLKDDYSGRLARRIELIQELVDNGLETLPMTMAPPYRALHINPDDFVFDERGNRWYTYEFDFPQPMSRVFGPLARYKFFHSKNDNIAWELDFENPNVDAWDYFNQQYGDCQQAYNFDFIRGDMAHVQLRPEGVPSETPAYYDPLRTLKEFVQNTFDIPYFGFFAETFLVEPNFMGYGDENDHLEAIKADATLGDLQSCAVGSNTFISRFNYYYDLLITRTFAPNFTIITADKDDPRFDEFYYTGNHLRMFVALFMTNIPSYMALGFETRNQHLERGKNEEYSKLFVFQIRDDNEPDKVTHGKYIWGQNYAQFGVFQHMKELSDTICDEIKGQTSAWLLRPDASQKMMAWTNNKSSKYIFITNTDPTVGSFKDDAIQGTLCNYEPFFDSTYYSEQHVCKIYKRIDV